MDVKGFQVWLSAARGLTRAQRREALAVLSGRSEGEASKAAIELGVDEARRCPHCASEGAVSRGPLMHMAPVARVCHQMLRLRLGRGNG